MSVTSKSPFVSGSTPRGNFKPSASTATQNPGWVVTSRRGKPSHNGAGAAMAGIAVKTSAEVSRDFSILLLYQRKTRHHHTRVGRGLLRYLGELQTAQLGQHGADAWQLFRAVAAGVQPAGRDIGRI